MVAGNERGRINLRQTVPSKRGMQMASGAISNFTILKVVGATFFACLLLLLPRGSYPCGFSPVFPAFSPIDESVFTPPINVPLKSSHSRGNRSRCVTSERIPVTFTQLLYLNENAWTQLPTFRRTIRIRISLKELIKPSLEKCTSTCDNFLHRYFRSQFCWIIR